ncbi:MAG: ribbon-helix-helix domain-containing protein [Sedimenticola sp.]
MTSKKQKRKMISAYLDPEQLEALKRLNKNTRVPVAEYIREGVDMVLEKYKKELKL